MKLQRVIVCGALLALLPSLSVTAFSTMITTSSTQTRKAVDNERAPTATQKSAFDIASTFQPDTFDPLFKNSHIQTIGGFFLRDTTVAYLPRNKIFQTIKRIVESIQWKVDQSKKNSKKKPFWDIRERIETPDGDFFDVDTKFFNQMNEESNSMVIMLHGLESCSDSALSRQIASACLEKGLSVSCINFRSCSEDENGKTITNRKLGGYHLGFTDDIKQYLDICRRRRPKQKIYIVGFSLGSNTALKALGELGDSAVHKYNIRGAALLCIPFDPAKNVMRLARPGINRMLYTNGLLQNMKSKAQQQLDEFCEGDPDTAKFDYKLAMDAETIPVFEDAYLAPIYGFQDCWDYYEKSASINFMEDVAVPTYIVNADDDPFFDCSVFPVDKTMSKAGKAPIVMQQTSSGGHLGFCFHQVDENDARLCGNRPSWAPAEAARFLHHVDSHPLQLRN